MTGEEYEKIAQIFLEKNIPIHVKLNNGTWYNGNITEVSSDFFMLNERLIGDTPVFFMQIEKLIKYERGVI